MNESQTPRTDKAEFESSIHGSFAACRISDFARQLERELNETKRVATMLADSARHFGWTSSGDPAIIKAAQDALLRFDRLPE